MSTDKITDDDDLKRDIDFIYDEYRSFEPLPSVVYHYTSLAAMIDICQSGVIRCSNIRFSNDPAEVSYGHDLVEGLIRKRFRGIPFDALFRTMAKMDYYAASFSAAPDSLPQWRAYCANGRGVAIGFNSDVFARHEHLIFGRVEYERLRQEQFVNRVLDLYEPRIAEAEGDTASVARHVAEIGETLVIIAGLLKDEAYASEHEYRAFVTQPRVRQFQSYDVKFRATAGSVVPFLEFSFADAAMPPVTEVMIGPCLDPAVTAPSIEAFLEQTFSVPPCVTRAAVKMRA